MIRPWGIQGPELQAVRKACGVSRQTLRTGGTAVGALGDRSADHRAGGPGATACEPGAIPAAEGDAVMHASGEWQRMVVEALVGATAHGRATAISQDGQDDGDGEVVGRQSVSRGSGMHDRLVGRVTQGGPALSQPPGDVPARVCV
ncbi:MAG: hypothetical protein GYA36_21135 [Veillonellaceae bacterium]|nr:hypothetical protein [Veillonellaceae bacterium]